MLHGGDIRGMVVTWLSDCIRQLLQFSFNDLRLLSSSIGLAVALPSRPIVNNPKRDLGFKFFD